MLEARAWKARPAAAAAAMAMAMAMAMAAAMAAGCTSGSPEDPDGPCPSDEVCSPKTPLGIQLSSPRMFDDPVGVPPPLRPVARGGTQLLSVLYEVPGGEVQPMDHPYVVDAGPALAVETVFSASLAVRGVEEGSALVRLVDERDGRLYGREIVESLALDRIEIAASGPVAAPPGRPFVFAVGPQWFGVRLLSAPRPTSPSVRLVDESTRLELPGAVQDVWDALAVTVTEPGVQTLAVHAGGGVRRVELPFVAQADAIVRAPEVPELFGSVGEESVHCFYATSGVRVIAGPTWSFAADTASIRDRGGTGCVEVRPNARGTLRLTVSTLGVSRELAITVL